MTPEQWARVFRAGWNAIPGKSEPAANALALSLRAMELEAKQIAEETT